jgi:hypothetical protein
LKDILWSKLGTIDVCNTVTNSFIKCTDAYVDMPHALIHGRSNMISRLIARKHVFNQANLSTHAYRQESKGIQVTTEVTFSGSGSKAELAYSSYAGFIEIDVEIMASSNGDRLALPELLKQIACQKHIRGHRHIIIIYNLDSLQSAALHAMRKVLETFSNNAYFVMTCRNQSQVIDAIKSRCILINSRIQTKNIATDLVDECRPELLPYVDVILHKAANDLVNFTMLLEIPCPDAYIGHLAVFVESRLQDICRTKDQREIENKIRDMCTKVIAACVPIPHFIKKIIDFATMHAIHCLNDIVAMSADVEHKIAISNKAVFAMEYFLHHLVILLRPHLLKQEIRFNA